MVTPDGRSEPGPADPGTLLATTHPLAGGQRARLRLTRPSDAPRVQAFLEGLSEETRRRRFLAPVPDVGDALVRHFTFFNPRERLVVAAALPLDGREAIAGLGDLALLETGLAELGLVVDDEHQRQGIGSLLCETLGRLALQRGATHLKAEMLEHNAAMAGLLERLGSTVRTVEGGHAVIYARLDALRSRAA